MNVTLCQLDLAWEDPPANQARAAAALAAAPPVPHSLVVLPEMFATGFSMNEQTAAQPADGPNERFLRHLALQYRITLVAGLATRDDHGHARNQALAFSPEGSLLARFTKLHPFTLGAEHLHYAAGDRLVLFPWQELQVAPFICYDLRFPEAFRQAARLGAQVFTVIANWPAARIHHWITLLRARAIENQAFVIGVNRVGHDPAHTYPGRSLVVDPLGEILLDAGEQPHIVSTILPVATLHQWRLGFPALRDRRTDLG